MTELTVISNSIIKLTNQLNRALKRLKFDPPISYCYNPAEYALKPYESYINKYCRSTKQILFIGMNPGPYGMCQTGVPFGEITHVLDWLNINEDVTKPDLECPNKPVLGFSCKMSEQSGLKFWGLFKNLCITPDNFFQSSFVYNYCPLAFFNDAGRNITPAEIEGPTRDDLEEHCDEMLRDVINVLKPTYLVGIGRYAEKRCNILKKKHSLDVTVLYLTHPSPRVIGNANWPEKAEEFLKCNNLMQYFKK